MVFRKSTSVSITTIGVGNKVAATKSLYLMVYFLYLMVYFLYEHKSFVTTV